MAPCFILPVRDCRDGIDLITDGRICISTGLRLCRDLPLELAISAFIVCSHLLDLAGQSRICFSPCLGFAIYGGGILCDAQFCFISCRLCCRGCLGGIDRNLIRNGNPS
ncbi:hypothetical protein D3C78_738930 [compost metagenome]